MRKKLFLFLWFCYILGIIAIGVVFHSIFTGEIGYMPNIAQLQNPVNKFATQVFSADGKRLGTWSYSSANRVFADYKDLPPALVDALIATEDARFRDHNGIDFWALTRAVIKRGLMRQKAAGGGSTITQQLAKQLYSVKAATTQERMLQKPIEWVIALKLERYYTKEEIITMYFNHFDFLHNAVGIKTAAQTYFGKEPLELDTCQCALLVGMCKNPSYFNPVQHPERCLERRNMVLKQMEKAGYLTAEQRERLRTCDLGLDFHRVSHNDGHGTYLRDYLRIMLMANKPVRSDYAAWQGQKYYEDSLAWEEDPLYGWCNKNLNHDGKHYNIYTDGLKIYTTLDSRMQEYAEQAVAQHVSGELQPQFDKELKRCKHAPYANAVPADKARANLARAKRQSYRYIEMKRSGHSEEEIDKAFNTPTPMTVYTLKGDRDTVMTPTDSIKHVKSFLHTGFMCMDSETGHVKAYIGGVDYRHFQYDMCTQGKRQVGSTMKPFLYSLAMQFGMSPCDEAPNEQRTYIVAGDQTWTPRNGSRARYGEMVPLKWGLATSNNWISAWLLDQMQPANLVKKLHDFGIMNRNIVPSLSLCLGPCDISVAEMVGAYTAFPQKGVRRCPMFVTRIEDSDGNVLADFQPRVKEVISEEAAYKMIVMMRSVMDGGTGSRMRGRYKITAPMGGKTGTTNDNSDGWFVGYTPRLCFGAWVGGDERDIHFANIAQGQGANAALPIVALFLQKVYRDSSLGYNQSEDFNIPVGFDPCGNVMNENDDEEYEEEIGFDIGSTDGTAPEEQE